MKYTLISMFSVNMLLKAVISSSAATMWSLIHVLQVFRYILLINIEMPSVMNIVYKYLGVVVGDIDEVQHIVPDIFNQYVVDSNQLNINITIYPKFVDNGKSGNEMGNRLRISISHRLIWKADRHGAFYGSFWHPVALPLNETVPKSADH